MNAHSDPREHFIADQQWCLLTEFENPKPWIDRLQVRTADMPTVETAKPENDPWVPVDRYDVARNQVELDGRAVELSRFCFTTDAGMGKSVAIEWMWAAVNHPALRRAVSTPESGLTGSGLTESAGGAEAEPGWLAFNIPHALLTEGSATSVNDRLYSHMCEVIKERIGGNDPALELSTIILERHRKTGRLLLLFDGLDHLSSVTALSNILKSNRWRPCSIGIGGRQFSLNNHWQTLFALDQRWKFIQVMPLNQDQQKLYLSADIWNQVNSEARHLLAIPRVIKYIKKLGDDGEDLEQLRTASDVFYGAIETLIIQGLNESAEARKITCESTVPDKASQGAIELCFRMLSAIAFEMVCDHSPKAIKDDLGQPTGEYDRAPNFQRVPKGGPMTAFREKLESRNRLDNFDHRWNALSSLSIGVLNALFDRRDPSVKGLTEIQFSNRGFQEFLCAYYLGHYCGLDKHQQIAPGHNDFLWDWIYLSLEPETHHYYEVWKYLAEMPRDAIHPPVWLESMAPVYSPSRFPDGAYGDIEQRITKRSNEILFRSWNRLEELIEQYPRAFEIRENWWSEFETKILAGDYGDEAKDAATELVNDFVEFPPGTLQMGIPDNKSIELPEVFRGLYGRILELSRSGMETDELVQMFIEPLTTQFGVPLIDTMKSLVRTIVANDNMEWFESIWDVSSRSHWHEVEIPEHFAIGRRPCTNRWFRLYSQLHGTEKWVIDFYGKYSGDDDQPAVYISFLDAWAICQWLRWDGRCCQLPWEDWWEYVCKFDSDPRFFYWWESDEWDDEKLTCRNNATATTVASPDHASPGTKQRDTEKGWGVMEMLGNITEPCLDKWSERHETSRDMAIGEMGSLRVFRGGSFIDPPENCVSGVRSEGKPGKQHEDGGVRFARVVRVVDGDASAESAP